MQLSELKTGERGIIVKVSGHGGFRKRIIEMGFVKGQMVEVLLNAPLKNPVKYKLMGYEVSLRHDEADLIEVAPENEALSEARRRHQHINVALIGNPNCGKTSLFNFASGAHAHVGNYSGVTVDATTAHATFGDYDIELTDLPGTYSLSCYSPEELYVRRHLLDSSPDVVINVMDASNLERNLYLTAQLVDMNLRMVCALNMYDDFERRGDKVDASVLSTLFGAPMIPTSFKSGRGVDELLSAVVSVYEDQNQTTRHIHINYGHEIEAGVAAIQKHLKSHPTVRLKYSTRYLALKLMEGDQEAEKAVHSLAQKAEAEGSTIDAEGLLAARNHASARILEETKTEPETAIMDARYGFVHGALAEAGYAQGTKKDTYHTTHIIDELLANHYLGFPIFFLILFVMFYATFALGQYPMDWIESAVAWIGTQIEGSMSEGPLRSMLAEGIVGGVGSVIVFLPQILILYFFISLMEDSGYMARAAFIMDKVMHTMGLHGKSFIPLVMGFGCNVPAVMATRTIESRRSKLITMMILPFMSCSARLPIYVMITGTFFSLQYRSWVMLSLYAAGLIVAVVVSKIFSTFVLKGEDTPFVMELPPYRWPTPKAIWRHTWEKGKEYLKKMGGIILVASIAVWALGYFPHNAELNKAEQQEQSYIGRVGKVVEPVFSPQGFNWKLDMSLIAGVGAKEIVASTIGVLYAGEEVAENDDTKYTQLRKAMAADGLTPLTAYCYLLFILLYFPCLATVVAIRNETGSWRWATACAAYTTVVAWIVSAVAYQVGLMI